MEMNDKDFNVSKYQKLLNRLRISDSLLKTVALICMFIDHIGAGLVFYDIAGGMYLLGSDRVAETAMYYRLRHIGRTAFPIYCYLLVEGFFHTRNRARYLIQLVLFAVLSEIPFDLALTFKRKPASSDWIILLRDNQELAHTAQNVFWTLALGLSAIWLIHLLAGRIKNTSSTLAKAAGFAAACAVTVVFSVTAQYYHTDYRWYGVCLITVFYVFYQLREYGLIDLAAQRLLGCAAGYLLLGQLNMEWWSLPGFILICFSSGRRGFLGRSWLKYFFYAFYPLHLILIYYLRCRLYGG